MSNLSLKLSDEDITKLKETFKDEIVPSNNEYIDTLIQSENVTISIYNSKKVLFQGKDAFIYASAFLKTELHPQAGSDEVGTGDYFGPVCVCACILEKEDYPILEEFHITDSKELSDTEIEKIAPILMQKLKYSLLILKNAQYNEVQKKNHMVMIKSKMHNQAYINLLHKGYKIPKAAYIDQFVAKETYFKYLLQEKEVYHDLIFETKAESKYPAVACASIIARYAFIKEFEKLEENFKMKLHKGAGFLVDEDAAKFIKMYGESRLNEVAKLHFKNTQKAKELLKATEE